MSVFLGAILTRALFAVAAFASEQLVADPDRAQDADSFEARAYQSVKDLQYPDPPAHDFIKMVKTWECEKLYRELGPTAALRTGPYMMSNDCYAGVEEDIVKRLARTIRAKIAGVNTTEKENVKYFDLALIVEEKKSQCLGFCQLFYVLGNSIGLTVRGVNVVEHSELEYRQSGHVACIVGLHNGKAIQVDLTLRDCVSRPFVFRDEYEKEGHYWKLKDSKNRLHIHPRVQLLGKNGLASAICNNRGALHREAGRAPQAMSNFHKAIELNPESAEAFNNRGMAYCALGKLPEAISDSDRAVALDPRDAAAYCARGVIHGRSGKLSESLASFDRAIELHPQFAEAYDERGTIYGILGESSKAIADHSKAIELKPELAKAYNHRGTVYRKLAKSSESLADFDKAITLDPAFAEAYGNRAAVYGSLGKYPEAISDFNKLIELKPGSAKAHADRACVYGHLGRMAEAKDDLRKALQLNPALRETVRKTADRFKLNL